MKWTGLQRAVVQVPESGQQLIQESTDIQLAGNIHIYHIQCTTKEKYQINEIHSNKFSRRPP